MCRHVDDGLQHAMMRPSGAWRPEGPRGDLFGDIWFIYIKRFIHDKPLYTGQCNCTHRRRIDHRKQIGNNVLAIETDEFGRLMQEIQIQVERIENDENNELLEIIKLYY